MKSDRRWLYIGGVALLAIIVVVGFVMRGEETDQARDAGDGSAAVDGASGDASDRSDAAPDGAMSSEDAAPRGEAVEVGAVPTDPEACRAYCHDLAERRALASGTDEAGCIRQLCATEVDETEGGSEPEEPVPTISEPAVPEMPDDCREQCRLLQQRGELREGTSLDDCYAALCGSEEEE